MIKKNDKLKSTIVISVYNDSIALTLILNSLLKQTVKNFEIIISEDGQSEVIRQIFNSFNHLSISLQHLTQEDSGFRKNIALNRAILAANTEHLIFIDGDCLLHPAFIESHQEYAVPGICCTGRRIELGKKISEKLRGENISLTRLTNRFFYFIYILPLLIDKAKNIESGIYSKTIHKFTRNREIRLLGCNFSCHKKDLIKINGFNEEYCAPGIGEDSDIDWRLIKSGVSIKNVKFSAIQYHLYHPRTYSVSTKNMDLFDKVKQSDSYTCLHGIKNINS